MTEEMDSITDNATWELVDLPPGHRAIGFKWVFKVKRDKHGNIVRHKVRLVAKGYVQRAGIDYDEVFAPVAHLESVRLMMVVAAHHGWEVHHMDVKSAFLNGELKEEVYVVQPAGFVVKGAEHKVLRLRKALYGLKQARRGLECQARRHHGGAWFLEELFGAWCVHAWARRTQALRQRIRRRPGDHWKQQQRHHPVQGRDARSFPHE
jgi:hypothetical protein